MKIFSLLCAMMLLLTPASAQQKKEPSVDAQVQKLMKSMTLEEKIGQMTQIDYEAVKNTPEDIIKYSIGSILWGGNSEIVDLSPKGWADCYDSLQRLSEKMRVNIPILSGSTQCMDITM